MSGATARLKLGCKSRCGSRQCNLVHGTNSVTNRFYNVSLPTPGLSVDKSKKRTTFQYRRHDIVINQPLFCIELVQCFNNTCRHERNILSPPLELMFDFSGKYGWFWEAERGKSL